MASPRSAPRPLRVHVASDLHLEISPWGMGPIEGDPQEVGLVILAGDTHTKHRGPAWAAARWPETPVVMVAGNHEFYGSDIAHEVSHLRRRASRCPNVHFLERDTVDLDGLGVRVAGATLWTDFDLFGEEHRELCMGVAHEGMNDYRRVKKLTPRMARSIHLRTVEWLEAEGERARKDGIPLIVVTHHSPIREGMGRGGLGDPPELGAAYASNRADLVKKVGASLWAFGHSHISMDQPVGHTRMVSNARGYVAYADGNPAFQPNLVIDVLDIQPVLDPGRAGPGGHGRV